MILTGQKIKQEMERGNIVIEPFNPKHLGPNSYDVTLSNVLKVYKKPPISSRINKINLFTKEEFYLDPKKQNETEMIEIPDEGYILKPSQIFLGATNESTISCKFLPIIEGRSSWGRLGLCIHSTAGMGDIGWGFTKDLDGKMRCLFSTWTLELSVIEPLKIYPNSRIAQVLFFKSTGKISLYKGKYSIQSQPEPSKSYLDF